MDLDVKELMKVFADATSVATRSASGTLLQTLSDQLPALIGGSADLGPSNKTEMKNKAFFSAEDRTAGTSISASGNTPWAALSTAVPPRSHPALWRYLPGVLRLYAPGCKNGRLMGIGSMFVFTHDSIFVRGRWSYP